MEFTGERYLPTEQGKIRLEHYIRYLASRPLANGKKVLDIACGEGYGARLLADVAASVTAVDISSEAIESAKSKYKAENLSFLEGDATNLAFPDDTFDLIVSFETIEHLAEQNQMLAELKRVLKAGGVLVISTPDKLTYSNYNDGHNEFHIKELTFTEFKDLLATCFSNTEFYGQQLQVAELIRPLLTNTHKSDIWFDREGGFTNESGGIEGAEYVIAVCSNVPQQLPILNQTVAFPESVDLVSHYVGFAGWAKQLEKLLQDCESGSTQLKLDCSEHENRAGEYLKIIDQKDRELAELNESLRNANHEVEAWQAVLDKKIEVIQDFMHSVVDSSEDANVSSILKPIAVVDNYDDFFEKYLNHPTYNANRKIEEEIALQRLDEYKIKGHCQVCESYVGFHVDMSCGGEFSEAGNKPNWRERLVCPECALNNRQRLVATLIKQMPSIDELSASIYLMEQVTPIYRWIKEKYKDMTVLGSEYLGPEYEGGSVVNNIRHEDVENLSFSDGELDIIISNDVFEHVPNPSRAFGECARVLKPGGELLFTVPFDPAKYESISRAHIDEGEIVYTLPKEFHGNPMSDEGSLVFTDFGWDLLESLKRGGFETARVEAFSSLEFAHLGYGLLIFRANKQVN